MLMFSGQEINFIPYNIVQLFRKNSITSLFHIPNVFNELCTCFFLFVACVTAVFLLIILVSYAIIIYDTTRITCYITRLVVVWTQQQTSSSLLTAYHLLGMYKTVSDYLLLPGLVYSNYRTQTHSLHTTHSRDITYDIIHRK